MLDVSADVEIDFGAGRGRLLAEGRDILLEVDEESALTGVVDRQTLRGVAATLSQGGLTLHVRRGDRLLLSAGHGVEPRLLGRLLRMPFVRVSARTALRAVLGRGHTRP